MVHLTGVKDQERTNKNDSQGGGFTISGIRHREAVVKMENALVVIGDSNVKVNNGTCNGCTALQGKTIRKNALAWIKKGTMKYSLLFNNCEHFATRCRYDKSFSVQSRMALAGVAAAAAAGFTIGVSLTFAAGLLLFLALTRNS